MKPGGYEIVVVGTSWGGLAALRALTSPLPRDFGLAVAVVQHRHKDSDRLLATILQERTALTVCEVEDKQPLLPGYLFIAPADYHLLVERRRLHIGRRLVRSARGRSHPDGRERRWRRGAREDRRARWARRRAIAGHRREPDDAARRARGSTVGARAADRWDRQAAHDVARRRAEPAHAGRPVRRR